MARQFGLQIGFALLLGCPPLGLAQDNVTIPKSRLEELERKEKELDRLKGDLTKAKDENAQLKRQPAVPPISPRTIAAQPALAHPSPPLATLPPLKDGEEIDALDLANHYRADPAAADARYKGHKFLLRGEIDRFEKPVFRRDYDVLLKTTDRDTRIICSFYPPDTYKAVFPANHGSELVALVGETRVPLAKVGQTVTLRAQCKGWKDSAVLISGAAMKPVRREASP